MPEPILSVIPANRGSTGKPRFSTAYAQALELQRKLYLEAMRSKLKPIERSSLARVWCELEETKRKLKMRPLPKPVDVTKLPGKLARVKQINASFEEPEPTTGSVQAGSDKPDLPK